MSLSKNVIVSLFIGGFILLALLVFIPIFAGTNNRVVTLEENVNTSLSNISKEEQRRVDLFNNLVDSVQDARTFEQETQVKLSEARSQANGGNIEQAQLTLQAVVEAYPEIKSIELYKGLNNDFSTTENTLAGYREQFNNDVRSYNNYTRSFWARIILGIMGYEKQDYKYLDYNVDNKEARDLFDKN